MPPESGLLEQVQTLGDLRKLVSAGGNHSPSATSGIDHQGAQSETLMIDSASHHVADRNAAAAGAPIKDPSRQIVQPAIDSVPHQYIYPHWPWRAPVHWLRVTFLELIARPLIWFLANPRVDSSQGVGALGTESKPMLIIANHVSSYDGPLVQYALPGWLRRRIAVAMSGEMLEDYRHFRNPELGGKYGRFYPVGPMAYWLLTALFNVFPLPRNRDFQRSFAHAGEALDRGFSVMIFPEGTRSASGQLARFRPGIGLLVRQSNVRVLPVAIRGLGELKQQGRGWFRSGKIEVLVGQPIQFPPEDNEAAITTRLQREVETLLKG
jgi:long-chain acyl-CoA synthetase